MHKFRVMFTYHSRTTEEGEDASLVVVLNTIDSSLAWDIADRLYPDIDIYLVTYEGQE